MRARQGTPTGFIEVADLDGVEVVPPARIVDLRQRLPKIRAADAQADAAFGAGAGMPALLAVTEPQRDPSTG